VPSQPQSDIQAALSALRTAIRKEPEPEDRKLLHQAAVLLEKVYATNEAQGGQRRPGAKAVVQQFFPGAA
jgi:hypothetical protein